MITKEEHQKKIKELDSTQKTEKDSLRKDYKSKRKAFHEEKHSLKKQYHKDKHEIKEERKSFEKSFNDAYEKEKHLSKDLTHPKEAIPKEKKPLPTEEENEKMRKAINLPRYTHGEEIFNSVTHMVGGGFGVVFLVVGVVCAAIFCPPETKAISITSMAIFGFCCVFLYTMSAIYHALHVTKAKKVFQIIDHCTVYVLIAGSYVPVCLMELTQIAPYNYVLLGCIIALAALGISLNGTMMSKWPVKVVSNILYIALGWTVVFFYRYLVQSLTLAGAWLFIGGGISYTVGAILYGIGKNVKYFHSIFHLFVNAATLLQFLSVLLYGIIFPAIGVI